MRGYTSPPRTGQSFREKKFLESTAKLQYNYTLFYSDTDIANSGAAETTLFSYTIPGKLISGAGESIRYKFVGITPGNANLKNIKIKLGSSTIFQIVSADPALTEWMIQGEIFSGNRSNTIQKTSHLWTADGGVTSYFQYGQYGEDLSQEDTLVLTAQGVASFDVGLSVVKGELLLAP